MASLCQEDVSVAWPTPRWTVLDAVLYSSMNHSLVRTFRVGQQLMILMSWFPGSQSVSGDAALVVPGGKIRDHKVHTALIGIDTSVRAADFLFFPGTRPARTQPRLIVQPPIIIVGSIDHRVLYHALAVNQRRHPVGWHYPIKVVTSAPERGPSDQHP